MERKDFIRTACGLCGLAVLPELLAGCKKSDTAAPAANFTVDLSQSANTGLSTAGGSKVVNSILIINTGSGYIALQADCTHEGCTVGYDGSSKINCPCHGGVYDLNGNVLSGPPPSALHKYTVTQSGTVLTIT
jgi:Rieske Fe-S protein